MRRGRVGIENCNGVRRLEWSVASIHEVYLGSQSVGSSKICNKKVGSGDSY